MKKKLTATLLAIASVISVIAFSGCKLINSWIFKISPPTVQTVYKQIDSRWNIKLPENLVLENYYVNEWTTDGTWYYELKYDGSDSTFNELLSAEQNVDFEKSFSNKKFDSGDAMYTQSPSVIYTPDLSQYNYFYNQFENTSFNNLIIIYIPQLNKLIIYDHKI